MDWVTEWWWHFHVKEERRRKKEERRKKRKEGRMAWKFWHSDFPKVSRHLIFNYSISFLKKIQIWFWHLYFLNYVILLTYCHVMLTPWRLQNLRSGWFQAIIPNLPLQFSHLFPLINFSLPPSQPLFPIFSALRFFHRIFSYHFSTFHTPTTNRGCQ